MTDRHELYDRIATLTTAAAARKPTAKKPATPWKPPDTQARTSTTGPASRPPSTHSSPNATPFTAAWRPPAPSTRPSSAAPASTAPAAPDGTAAAFSASSPTTPAQRSAPSTARPNLTPDQREPRRAVLGPPQRPAAHQTG